MVVSQVYFKGETQRKRERASLIHTLLAALFGSVFFFFLGVEELKEGKLQEWSGVRVWMNMKSLL